MGMLNFLKDAGERLFGKDEPAQPTDEQIVEKLDLKIRQHGFEVQDLKLGFSAGVATVSGLATPEVADKVVVTLGNVQGVSQVDDRMERLRPPPPITHHTVKKGDTLSAIAATHYGVALLYPAIFEANRPMLEHPDRIYPGQVLIVPLDPAPLTYEVQRGDTLGNIAQRYYGEARQYTLIFEANRGTLSDPDHIKVGQQLRIPAKPAS